MQLPVAMKKCYTPLPTAGWLAKLQPRKLEFSIQEKELPATGY